MAIKSSGSSLAFSEIEAEFGQNGGRSLGAYRLTQSVGSLSNLPLDSGIPTSGQIKFSDFYGKKLNVVVDCHSGGREDRKSAKGDKWNNNAVTVIGGFRTKKEGGSKIIINVNKKFCSDKSNQINCALKTGSWDSTATVQVDVGSSGEVLGAGGDGGKGADGINNIGDSGSPGTSALGIEHNGVTVILQVVEFSVVDSVVEEEAVEVAKQIKEEIEELAVEAVAVELVAPLVMVDKVEILEEDLVQEQVNQVEQVLKPLEVVAVVEEIMLDRQVVDLVVQVDRHLVTLVVVKVGTLQVVLVVEMELP